MQAIIAVHIYLNASNSAMGFRGKHNLDFLIQDTQHSSPVIFARSSTDHPRWTTEAQLYQVPADRRERMAVKKSRI